MSFHSEGFGLGKEDLVVVDETKKDVEAHYDFEQQVGHGAFGEVYRVVDKVTGDERICKEVGLSKMSELEVSMMQFELDVTQKLDHPHIVRLYEYCHDESTKMIYIIMELIPGGDVRDLIDKEGADVDEVHAAKFMRQHLRALEYCHHHNILHKDIKPENMMLTIKDDPENADLKVIDFGLAQAVTERFHKDTDVIAGTPPYMAPELITEQPFDEAVDLWSIGVSQWNLLTNTFPFGDMVDNNGDVEKIKRKIAAGDLNFDIDPWEPRSKYAKDFAKKLLTVDPDDRMTATEAMEHPWLAKYNPVDHHGVTDDVGHALMGFSDAPHFVQACCLIIATQLSDEEMHDIRMDFASLDEDGEGEIPVEVLKDALSNKKWFCFRNDDNAQKIAEHADLNGDGFISFSEFAAACIHDRLEGDDVCERAFDVFDQDRDGLIDFEDIETVLEKPHVQDFEATSGIDYLDLVRPLAHGGQIDFGEFRDLLLDPSHQPLHQKQVILNGTEENEFDSDEAFQDDTSVKPGGIMGLCSPCTVTSL